MIKQELEYRVMQLLERQPDLTQRQLTPQGIVEKTAITTRFLARKQQEYEALREEIKLLRKELKRQSWEQNPDVVNLGSIKAGKSSVMEEDF